MRRHLCCTFALATVAMITPTLHAQAPAAPPSGMNHAPAQEEKAHAIENGGIFVPGWKATVDAGAVKQGQSEKDSSNRRDGCQQDAVGHGLIGE